MKHSFVYHFHFQRVSAALFFSFIFRFLLVLLHRTHSFSGVKHFARGEISPKLNLFGLRSDGHMSFRSRLVLGLDVICTMETTFCAKLMDVVLAA